MLRAPLPHMPLRARLLGLVVAATTLVALLAAPGGALAEVFQPAGGASGAATIVGFLDTPQAGQQVPGSGIVEVRGWVVDETAAGWPGVNGVEIWSAPSDAGGTLLGVAAVDVPRPDVAAALGNPAWTNSGFDTFISLDQVPWGGQSLAVYALTPGRGTWLLNLPVVKAAAQAGPSDSYPGQPVLRVTDPLPQVVIRSAPAVLRGIALDQNVQVGTGVDRVEIYIGGPRETGGQLIAVANLGKRYGEAGVEFGDSRFDVAGWDATWDPSAFPNGTQTLWVYAHRVGSDVWTSVSVPVVISL